MVPLFLTPAKKKEDIQLVVGYPPICSLVHLIKKITQEIVKIFLFRFGFFLLL